MVNFIIETIFPPLVKLSVLYLLLCNLPSFVFGRHLCQNNGTMKIEGKHEKCQCSHPFTGPYCEDYACLNGLSTGSQYDAQSPFFNKRCLCDSGWTGELCDVSLINRCGDKGDEVSGRCLCHENFAGDRCQYVTRCINGQLYNGRCACHYGWSGDFCDQIICHQGSADVSNKTCICPEKYRGKYCDFCAKPSSSPPPECAEISGKMLLEVDGDNVAIFLGVLLLIMSTISCAFLYIFYQKFASRKRATVTKMRDRRIAVEMKPLKDIDTAKQGTPKEDVKLPDIPPPPYEIISSGQGLHKDEQIKKDTENETQYVSNAPTVKFCFEPKETVNEQEAEKEENK